MRPSRVPQILFATGLLAGNLGVVHAQETDQQSSVIEAETDYNREIRPILAENCYTCHGPDPETREMELRFDRKEVVFSEEWRQENLVVPGHAEKSLLFLRITAEDDAMPPPESGKSLSASQIDRIRRWIDQGAEWHEHWSYTLPDRPHTPQVRSPRWPRNPVDHFILARLERENLAPSPEADRITLLRRLSLDLLGLPPRPKDIDAFRDDQDPHAYEQQVERLLQSPHYGERMAIFWLDLVRFADTRGYHSDNPRNVFPYRDYVIGAFNKNQAFDRFTVAQLAGDLLPDPTLDQRVASCYNKLNKTTEEGGAQAREYEAKSAEDRVRNVAEVWLGATMGCAQCHDHKFDPYTAKDFYSMAAFFADIQESAISDRDQGIPMPTRSQRARMKSLDASIAALKKELEQLPPAIVDQLVEAQARWETSVDKDVPEDIGAILAIGQSERTGEQQIRLMAHYRSIAPALREKREALAQYEKEKKELDTELVRCLVSVSCKPRMVRVLPRGNWMDDSGEVVQPSIPQHLGMLQTDGRRATRMDLARWLVGRENPLTARVFVNRFWKLFFGTGISKRLEDLGAMGEHPVHPELLDWLALEFMESGWDVKHMVKLMVLSSTYRQTSLPTPDLLERDPYNRLHARQSRWRLDAEIVRDNALIISGLLSRKIGGPSVKPHQPAGYWTHLNFPKRKWVADRGEDAYRRGLYTWWQRSFLHPSLMAFDAPNREECMAERSRSNVPQQALVLLNDPTYVEAARDFARRAIREGGSKTDERVRWAFRQALAREPGTDEIAVLADLHQKHREAYGKDREAAAQLTNMGQAPVPEDINVCELAAWTSVTRTILNLHETVTRN